MASFFSLFSNLELIYVHVYKAEHKCSEKYLLFDCKLWLNNSHSWNDKFLC